MRRGDFGGNLDASDVREGVEAWIDAGVTTPILVPSSTSGGQLKALDELFSAFA